MSSTVLITYLGFTITVLCFSCPHTISHV